MTTLPASEFQLERVARLVRDLSTDPVGAEERSAALVCLIDTLGCAIAGASDPTTRRTAAAFAATSARENGTGVLALGVPTPVDVPDALLINGAAIRALDFNDTFSGRNNHHPSESVIPIALALAELEDWSGARLLDAVAIGYRLSLTLGERWSGLLARGWAPAATLGQLSSAAYIAVLRSAPPEVLVQSMAIAAVTAPALAVVFRGELSDTKSLVSGLAAQAAWRAVQLASAGGTGPRDVLEGSGGYNELVGGEPVFDGVSAAARTDARSIWHKAFPTVFTIHGAIEAALELRSALGADAEALLADPTATIQVRVPPKVATMAATPARWTPTTRESAQFSLPYCVATALLLGACDTNALEEAMDGQVGNIQALLLRMQVLPDERWSGYAGGRVELHAGGSVRFAEVDQPKGSADNPLSLQEVTAKFTALAARAAGPEVADEILAALSDLASAASVAPLIDALARAAADAVRSAR